ncbi:hypothetical protein DQ04_05561010 [Trypanosoma grayi]|uniref:hypothetical protein n=1 Tax=Trypanosoma grayi TaxID=71804 RepID=UPI0004F44C3A|nr:hypothetical protein DQ04_05561010 [Trypanosoma grayi]KEG09237.1 hypothetical protein DQ04_05561010 [Trypanosoma grayi]
MAQRVSARRTADEWQDAFYSLEERHRQLQQRLNEREQEVKLLKVAQRRGSTAAAAAPLANSGSARPGAAAAAAAANVHSRATGARSVTAASTAAPRASNDLPKPPQLGASEVAPASRSERNVQFVSAPAAARKDDAAAAAAEFTSAWSAAPPPDPSMVWGMENSIQNYVTANALYHANEELRHRLDDAVSLVQTLQHELAASRSTVKAMQTRLDDATQQMHHLVRERDVAQHKLGVSQQAVGDLERSLQGRATEEERLRFALESQVTELRSRLVVGADSNELLSRDVRTLLAEVKEKASEAQSLRSRLSLAEAALASQKQNNENLLVELRSLNSQLVNERKRLLAMTREAQLASLRAEDVKDVEARLAEAVAARTTLEHEHVQLMESLVGVTEGALRQAREEVRHDMDECRAAAAHWEQVAQLLYKDIAQRTQAHVQCREECEEAKRDRDEATIALRDAWDELKLCRAKLDIVWPTHRADTRDLAPAEILATFGNYKAVFRQQRKHQRQHGSTPTQGALGRHHEAEDDGDSEGDVIVELCDVPLEEQVRELHEANGALLAELTQLRLTSELQAERLRTMEGGVREERAAVQAAEEALQRREDAAQDFLQTQLDRVTFLEAQVRSLRGYDVSPNMSLQELADGETVFELFLGQILSTETPEGVGLRNAFPPLFCSVDFLLHETVTTPIVTGLNAFFDTTVAFRVAMDALLQCYLQTRELLVQLHRVRSQSEIQDLTDSQNSADNRLFAERLSATLAEGTVSLWPLVADAARRDAQRPTLRGHIPLRTSSGHHIASMEFVVTVRTPFSESFRALAASAARDWRPTPNVIANAPASRIIPVTGEAMSTGAAALSLLPTTSSSAAAAATTGVVMNMSRGDGRMQLVPTPHQSDAFDGVSTTSSSTSLLDTRASDRMSGFTLVPRAAAMASVSTSASTTIRMLVVDVCKLQLPHTLPSIPRLSCYYALAPLGRDVYLPAPPTPRYECEYLQEGGDGGTRFPVLSMRELLAVTREPFMLFFFDESSSAAADRRGRRGEGPYWALAVAEWRLALERPEEYVSLELPLMNQQGVPVQGAVVRVRLLATSRAENAESGLAGALERARAVAATPPLWQNQFQQQQPQQQQQQQQQRASITSPEGRGGAAAVFNAASAARVAQGTTGNPPRSRNAEDSIELEMIRRQLDR